MRRSISWSMGTVFWRSCRTATYGPGMDTPIVMTPFSCRSCRRYGGIVAAKVRCKPRGLREIPLPGSCGGWVGVDLLEGWTRSLYHQLKVFGLPGWHDLKIKGGSRYCAHLHYSEILQGHAQASVIRIKPHDIARPFAAFLHFELHDVFSFCEVYGHAHFDETRWYGNLRYRYAA